LKAEGGENGTRKHANRAICPPRSWRGKGLLGKRVRLPPVLRERKGVGAMIRGVYLVSRLGKKREVGKLIPGFSGKKMKYKRRFDGRQQVKGTEHAALTESLMGEDLKKKSTVLKAKGLLDAHAKEKGRSTE